MKILIKQVTVVDPLSSFNGQSADILIENGTIAQIATTISAKADKEIAAEGLCVSPGWVDVFAHFGDPGFEFKETLETAGDT
jgi:dihydroorotase